MEDGDDRGIELRAAITRSQKLSVVSTIFFLAFTKASFRQRHRRKKRCRISINLVKSCIVGVRKVSGLPAVRDGAGGMVEV